MNDVQAQMQFFVESLAAAIANSPNSYLARILRTIFKYYGLEDPINLTLDEILERFPIEA